MLLERLRDRIHRSLDRPLLPLCRALVGFGVRPNQITVTGTLVCLLGAVAVAQRLHHTLRELDSKV